MRLFGQPLARQKASRLRRPRSRDNLTRTCAMAEQRLDAFLYPSFDRTRHRVSLGDTGSGCSAASER